MGFKLHSSAKRTRGQIAASAASALLALALLSCYEDLPPVEQPLKVEEVTFGLNVANDGLVMLDAANQPLGSIGALDVRVTNLYSEYLADTAQIEVEISMYVKDLPEKSVVLTMSGEDLWSPSIFPNGLLAIAPHQQARIMKQWSHRTQQGDPFVDFTDTPLGMTVVSQSGKPFLAFRVHLMVKASVKIFRNRPTEYCPADRNSYTEYIVYYTRG